MLSKILTICLTGLVCVLPMEAGLWDNVQRVIWKEPAALPPQMKVLVIHDVPQVSVEVRGKYRLYDPHTKAHLSTRFIGKKKNMELMSGGLKWGEEFPGLHQIAIVPEEGASVIVNNVPYQGSIFIYDIGGSLSVVNELDLDDYLSAILPKEGNPNWVEETYAALIITSRTNAYYQYLNPKTNFWTVDANVVGYDGSMEAKSAEPILTAMRNTRNMILSSTGHYEGKVTPFLAQWSASSKGNKGVVVSKISIDQANDLAKSGEHAAQILGKAFPETSIQLINP